jgi:hypothetical protein
LSLHSALGLEDVQLLLLFSSMMAPFELLARATPTKLIWSHHLTRVQVIDFNPVSAKRRMRHSADLGFLRALRQMLAASCRLESSVGQS